MNESANAAVEGTDVAQGTSSNVSNAGTFAATYNFKTISQEDYNELFEKFAAQGETKESFFARIQGGFEFPGIDAKTNELKDAKKFAKRKSLTLTLHSLNDVVAALAGNVAEATVEFVSAAINKVITDYVKVQYVDTFQDVGVHDLAAILEYQASTGTRGGGVSIDEATYKAALESFKVCMVSALGNEKGAEMLTTIAKARFTPSAVTRANLQLTETTAQKLETRVDQWGAWLNETAPEQADDFAIVHNVWINNIKKLTKQQAQVNLEDIL